MTEPTSRPLAPISVVCALLALAACGPAETPDAGAIDDAGATPDGAAPFDGAVPDQDGGTIPGTDAGAMDAGGGTGTDAGVTDAGAPSDAGATDAGATDAGAPSDAGATDAGATDAGPSGMDAGLPDAGLPDAGLPDAGSPPFDECSELDCSVAPAPVCLDATRLSTSTPTGTCAAGVCGATTATTTCAGACVEGACVSATCGATTCVTPGGPTCVSAQDIAFPSDVGTCSGGTCDYAGWVATCSGGCAGTACAPGSWLRHVRDPGRSFWTCMAMDPEDRPHIFYYGATGSTSTLLETALTPTGWETRTIETAAAAGLHHPLDCAIDRTGTAHVVYEDQTSASVRYARRPRGGTWAVEFLAAGGLRAYALLMRDTVPVAVFGDATGTAVAERTPSGWVEERRTPGRTAHTVAAFDSRGEVVIGRSSVSSSSSGDSTASQIGLPDASGGWTFESTPEIGWINDMVIDRATDTIEITLSNLSPTFIDVHTRSASGVWTQALVGGSLGDGRQGELAVEADGTLHVAFVGRCGAASSSYGTCHAVRGAGGFTVTRAGGQMRARGMSMVLDAAGDPHLAGPDDLGFSDDLIYLRPH